jgi:hypothetical protein
VCVAKLYFVCTLQTDVGVVGVLKRVFSLVIIIIIIIIIIIDIVVVTSSLSSLSLIIFTDIVKQP